MREKQAGLRLIAQASITLQTAPSESGVSTRRESLHDPRAYISSIVSWRKRDGGNPKLFIRRGLLTRQKMAICSAATRRVNESAAAEFINLSRHCCTRAATINYADARTEPLGGAIHFIKRAMRKSSRETARGRTTIAV